MTYNKDMLSMFTKKVIELPLYSYQCMIVKSPTINKGYRLMSGKNLRVINSEHLDCVSLRTVSYLDNLSNCEQLKKLTHPLLFSPLIEDLDESQEVISLLEKDILTDFTFQLQVENVNSVMYQMVFSVLGKLQHLKKLKVT